jgi:hypothetical protein
MRRSLPLAVALAVLALAAPAQAEISASRISAPADPHFVLVDFDKPAPTIDIAGTATGEGNVDIVCVRAGAVHLLLRDQPVAASGAFALSDVPLTGLPGTQVPYGPGLPCRLLAWPAGVTPLHMATFDGPALAISSIVRHRRSTGGPNDGAVYEADVYASGLGFAARAETFGSTGLFNAFQAAANSSDALQHGLFQTGAPADNIDSDHFGLKIDGLAAYAPARTTNIVGTYFGDNFGARAVGAEVTSFSPTTGDLTLVESDPLVRCPNAVYVPTPVSCSSFVDVPVRLERTTAFSYDTRTVRVSDRWVSTDGQPHRLDLSLRQSRCYGTQGCSADVVHRLPGDADYGDPVTGGRIGPIEAEPIFSRHAGDDSLGGTAVIPGQRADFARFDTQYEFVLGYENRTIPATGELVLTHTYVTSGLGSEIEQSLDAALAPPPAPPTDPTTPTDPTEPTEPAPPHGSTPAPSHTVAPPELSRRGQVRVRRAGRTFVVRTRDRVQCPDGCVVTVRGSRVRAAQTTVAPGATARVAVRLNRRGVRVLTRRGRARLVVSLSARAATGAPVTRVRHLTVRLP